MGAHTAEPDQADRDGETLRELRADLAGRLVPIAQRVFGIADPETASRLLAEFLTEAGAYLVPDNGNGDYV